MTKHFKRGQPVVYMPTDENGNVYKIQYGIVNRMNVEATVAFVWYHLGCTSTGTPVKHLYPSQRLPEHSTCHTGCNNCTNPVDANNVHSLILDQLQKFWPNRVKDYETEVLQVEVRAMRTASDKDTLDRLKAMASIDDPDCTMVIGYDQAVMYVKAGSDIT